MQKFFQPFQPGLRVFAKVDQVPNRIQRKTTKQKQFLPIEHKIDVQGEFLQEIEQSICFIISTFQLVSWVWSGSNLTLFPWTAVGD